ncbi:hypothetical protein D0T49_09585 [Paludibacter sp. 221]|nr:hypothetical protein [Paludibacter sp. 221]
MEVKSDKSLQLYSQKSIALSTFFGSPLAAGILIRRNCINLGNKRQGLYALVISIVFTVLLFGVSFAIPDDIAEKIPNFVVPLAYTGIIYLIVEKIQGAQLKRHEINKEPFYSAWRALGVGVVCLLVIMASIFTYVWFFQSENWDVKTYDKGLAEFTENENEALELYDMFEYAKDYRIIDFIKNTGIPKWEENIKIMEELNKIEGITPEFIKQNRLLIEYCNLRIESYELLLESVENKAIDNKFEIDDIYLKIDKILNELK